MGKQPQIQTSLPGAVALGLIPALLCGFVLAGGSAAARGPAPPAAAQAPSRAPGIWEGVFTDAQADRGKEVFHAICAECHGNGVEAPSLTADSFMRSWEGHSLDRLYTKIRDRMPANNVQSVRPEEKLDALTYILREQGFPSGAHELKADAETLAQIQIVRKSGPGPLRTGASVQVVGCLTGAADAWALTHSTEPTATTFDPQTPADRTAVEGQPLGTETVRLLAVFPSPSAHGGHRIEAKGFLVRDGNDVAINVVFLRSVAPTCP